MRPFTTFVSIAAAAALLTACQGGGDGTAKPADKKTSAPQPCLITAAQLTEITDTSQELLEPEQDGDEFSCATFADERGAMIRWNLRELPANESPTSDDLSERVGFPEDERADVVLGEGQNGWVAWGDEVSPRAHLLTVIDSMLFEVEVVNHIALSSEVDPEQLKQQAIEIATAYYKAATAEGS